MLVCADSVDMAVITSNKRRGGSPTFQHILCNYGAGRPTDPPMKLNGGTWWCILNFQRATDESGTKRDQKLDISDLVGPLGHVEVQGGRPIEKWHVRGG